LTAHVVLDGCLEGGHDVFHCPTFVIPAKAGIYDMHRHSDCGSPSWMPTYVGKTLVRGLTTPDPDIVTRSLPAGWRVD
jgi:hypothetical protein